MKKTTKQIHSLLFLQPNGIEKTELCTKLNLSEDDLEISIIELSKILGESGVELIADTSRLQLAATSKDLPEDIQKELVSEPLSTAALEVLSIVAYHQPITQFEIETMRGVGSEQSLKSLIEKNLLLAANKKVDGLSVAHYSTSNDFLNYLGIKSISQLPPLAKVVND